MPSPGPRWLLGQTRIRSVTTLVLIILYLAFLFSNLLAVASQQYPQHPEARRAERGMQMEGKESTRPETAAGSRVDADRLLNSDCEVFPFIFEMGVDAFVQCYQSGSFSPFTETQSVKISIICESQTSAFHWG